VKFWVPRDTGLTFISLIPLGVVKSRVQNRARQVSGRIPDFR
jgi:hypothetical protein